MANLYVIGFKAEPMMAHHMVKLTWKNPTDPDFSKVVVFRRTDQYQTDPASPFGIQIYSGTATTLYDYWMDGTQVPTTQVTYPQIANTDLSQSLTDMALKHRTSHVGLLTGGQVYYYTVFSYDNLNNFYYSPATQGTARPLKDYGWQDRLWSMVPPSDQQLDGGRENDPLQKNQGQYQRLLGLKATAFNLIEHYATYMSDFTDIDECEPWKLDYIAATLGWTLDKTMSLSMQRITLKRAVSIYQLAGTRKGLDLLVKYHSGFPTTSGVSEGSAILLYSPLFSNNQMYYTDRVAPDFTGSPTLFYCYDFSSSNITGTNTFTAYVQPTYSLTAGQITALTTRLKTALDQFVPFGVSYNINIMN